MNKKHQIEDFIEISYPGYDFDTFINQLNEVKQRIKTVWDSTPLKIGFSHTGEITIYFNRLETDLEYNSRINKEEFNKQRELNELARLKAKYESKT